LKLKCEARLTIFCDFQ